MQVRSPRHALAKWKHDLTHVRTGDCVSGAERVIAVLLVCTRLVSLSWWFRTQVHDPTTDSSRTARDTFVDAYVFTSLAVMLLALRYAEQTAAVIVAAYIVFELYAGLFRILFLGKHPGINAPTPSFERSLLLLACNACQVVVAFAVFYAHVVPLAARDALLSATLVFGTIGYPPSGNASALVITQVALDFILVVFFVGTFASQAGLFRRSDRSLAERTPCATETASRTGSP